MRNALKEVLTTVDETSIEKFIKFLEKDKRGRINYSEFINKMNDVSN
jgi:Ca2+-binding EF-hand superfamily protein